MHQLLDALPESEMGIVLIVHPIVVGVGSSHGDDQAGWFVVSQLRDLGYPDAALYRAVHPADLFDVALIDRPLIVCDACEGSNARGTIHRFIWPTDRLLEHHSNGTHDLSLLNVLMIGQTIACFPKTVTIWTIEGQTWSSEAPAAAEVENSAAVVARRIWDDVHHA
jgi:hydrogenase maturation protease